MKKFLITSLTLALSLNCFINAEEKIEEKNLTILLPVNWVSSPKYNLSVTIPNNTKPIQKLSEFEKHNMIEFIPENESSNNWSEIITLHKFVGESLQAIALTNLIVNQFKSSTKNLTIWGEETSKTPVESSFIGMTYKLNGKIEVIGLKYFSGPFDSAGAQYTIRVANQEGVVKAEEKIKQFFKTNVVTTSF